MNLIPLGIVFFVVSIISAVVIEPYLNQQNVTPKETTCYVDLVTRVEPNTEIREVQGVLKEHDSYYNH